MTRDTETFRAIGEALFGLSWQTSLSIALHVEVRTVQRWAGGATLRPWVWDELKRLCIAHAATATQWAERIDASAA